MVVMTFESSVDNRLVDDIIAGMNGEQIALAMPKFEFDSSFGLVKTLAELGMPIAFTTDADFSGMTGNDDLFIGDVIHKAFVSVDESGTEAAAATAVVMEMTAIPQPPLEVSIDRPFIFLIRDTETGTVLFVGRVLDPSK